MSQELWSAIETMGEDEFRRRMEGLPSFERKKIFQHLHVPAGGASVSARQRTEKRIRLAWKRLTDSPDEDACEMFARAWLGHHGMPMIIEFLDAVGVAHKEGYLEAEDALQELSPESVSRVLTRMAEKHDPGDVRLYAILMELPGVEVAAS